MSKIHHRVFAGFFAVLFLVTSSAFTIGIIWQALSNKDSNKTSPKSNITQSATTNTNPTKETKVDNNQLQGKPLADFVPVASIPELQKLDTTPGNGEEVKAGDTVTVDYTGAVAATGIVFQSSKDSGQPITFPLSGVIAGWSQGVPGMKVNGTRRLLIPANLAYGANPPSGSGIPANADLVFDITLHKIGK